MPALAQFGQNHVGNVEPARLSVPNACRRGPGVSPAGTALFSPEQGPTNDAFSNRRTGGRAGDACRGRRRICASHMRARTACSKGWSAPRARIWRRATGIALIDQNWRLALDHWPSQGCALLTIHPVREILSVTAYGTEGEASLIDPADYQLDTLSRPARLHFETRPGAAAHLQRHRDRFFRRLRRGGHGRARSAEAGDPAACGALV